MTVDRPKECQRIQGYLDDFLIRELATDDYQKVLNHLNRCSHCAEELATRQRVKGLLKKAVQRDWVPLKLEEQLRQSIEQAAAPKRKAVAFGSPWLAAAAALMLAVLGVTAAWKWTRGPHRDHAGEAAYGQASLENIVKVLAIGVLDHIECALSWEFEEPIPTEEEMSREVGPAYGSLVFLVRDRAGKFRLAEAHQCEEGGRAYVHLLFRNNTQLLSLAITRKRGETFSGTVTAGSPSIQPGVFSAQVDGQQAAGFETAEHLAFVVSALTPQENSQIASELAQPVREFLSRLEG